MSDTAVATLRTFAEAAALAGDSLASEGLTEWSKHLKRDAEIAGIRATNMQASADEQATTDEMADVPQFIKEANQAESTVPQVDQSDLRCLETALHELAEMHDAAPENLHSGPIRECRCQTSAIWRHGIGVTHRLRNALGLRVRLVDRV